MTPRFTRFLAVGLLGFFLQLAALWILIAPLHWPWLPATIVSVELAVVHNYLWHAGWTWRDRAGTTAGGFFRFQIANGVASVAGNTALMAVLAGVLCAACVMTPSRASAQAPEAVAAWERYVAATEARLERSRSDSVPRTPPDGIAATGESLRAPSSTISDWRGSVFVPGVTLDHVLHRLQHPGTPPPQEDVVSSRVLARTDDSLRLTIRLVRHAIVTVSYDTEHEMRFQRWTPRLATARSVATRIEEVGGSDHGFLWRLNSYWRYEQIEGGVLVDLESLTLSRDVPSLIRPIAAPLVARIARESVLRTLAALQRFFNTADTKDTTTKPVAQTR